MRRRALNLSSVEENDTGMKVSKSIRVVKNHLVFRRKDCQGNAPIAYSFYQSCNDRDKT